MTVFAPWNLTIGARTSIGDGAILYNLGSLWIGDDVTVSQRSHLCGGSHDYTTPGMPLLKCPIRIGNAVWLAAEVFVGPNVQIGDQCVVGARAVVVKSVPSGVVVVGNPGRVVRERAVARGEQQ